MRLVLASASPRRKELLTAAGVRFIADAVDIDETARPGESPHDYVGRVALAKARAGFVRHPDDIVLGADTTVVLDGDMLGKPADDADAARMLRRLSGRAHEVLTGIALVWRDGERRLVERTAVWMSTLTEAEIEWYVNSQEPLDKAGAYAIQGRAARFIPRIEGSYTNVVGLPVAALLQLMGDAGVSGDY